MHSRLRTHAESIAFFGGGSREKTVRDMFPLSFVSASIMPIEHILTIISDGYFFVYVTKIKIIFLYLGNYLITL